MSLRWMRSWSGARDRLPPSLNRSWLIVGDEVIAGVVTPKDVAITSPPAAMVALKSTHIRIPPAVITSLFHNVRMGYASRPLTGTSME